MKISRYQIQIADLILQNYKPIILLQTQFSIPIPMITKLILVLLLNLIYLPKSLSQGASLLDWLLPDSTNASNHLSYNLLHLLLTSIQIQSKILKTKRLLLITLLNRTYSHVLMIRLILNLLSMTYPQSCE